MILLQKLVNSFALDGSFKNQWVSEFSVKKVLAMRYTFDSSLTIIKVALSHELVKIYPQSDSESIKKIRVL